MSKVKFFMQELGNLYKSESTFGEFMRSIKGQKPQTLGEGLKRVKHSFKGVGEDLHPSKVGERTYKTSDGSFLNIFTENLKVDTSKASFFEEKICGQAGTVLRVLRPSRNPVENVYGVSRLRYLLPKSTDAPKINNGVQEVATFTHKTNNETKKVLDKVVCDPTKSTIQRMTTANPNLNTRTAYVDRGFWNNAPYVQTEVKIKFPERAYSSALWHRS